MVDLPLRDQVVRKTRRAVPHLVDIDAGVEQQASAGDPI